MKIHSRWIALSRWSGQFDPRELLGLGPLERLKTFPGAPPGLCAALARCEGLAEVRPEVRKLGDADYPCALLDLERPPPLLWGRGRWELLDEPALAVVGARACTAYGRSVAGRIGSAAATEGVVVVSGAARGIDRAAQTAALDAGGRTLSVLGAGLDAHPPRAAVGFYDRVEVQGLAVSEFPPDTPPSRFTFPRRNRIIAALSQATVVVEAARRSGALHTANAALRLGRPLLAVPGPVDGVASQGCNRLIAQGAGIVTTIADALAPVRPPGGLIDSLAAPITVTQLAAATGQDARRVAAQLVALELTGRVRRLADRRYVRT